MSAVPPTIDRSLGTAPRKPTWRFMLSHPAHFVALGFGSGLSPVAPGTTATLWAWVAFLVLQPHFSDPQWAVLIGAGTLLGWWACTLTAAHLALVDPSAIVCDEVLAFWLVLWLVAPTDLAGQLGAFVLFRMFDAAKPGPVAWAERLFMRRSHAQPIGWAQGVGILFDDFVAAACVLLVIALWRFV